MALDSSCLFMPISRAARTARLTDPLLFPGIAPHVVSAPLPEAGLVASHELDSLDPLGALPRIEAWNYKAQRPAMLRRNGLPVVSIRKKSVFGQEVFER